MPKTNKRRIINGLFRTEQRQRARKHDIFKAYRSLNYNDGMKKTLLFHILSELRNLSTVVNMFFARLIAAKLKGVVVKCWNNCSVSRLCVILHRYKRITGVHITCESST